MSPKIRNSEEFEETFRILSGLVNELSAEDRIKLREKLGAYTHDLKNTIGLVTGANVLISRSAEALNHDTGTLEMTELITSAASRLDDLIMLMVENLNNEIEVN